jgi:hypothetical protein
VFKIPASSKRDGENDLAKVPPPADGGDFAAMRCMNAWSSAALPAFSMTALLGLELP